MSTQRKDGFQTAAVLAGIPTLLLGLLGVVVALGAWVAYVAHKFYGWFVVPLGAPALSWWHVWGLLIMYNLITYKTDDREKSKEPGPIGKILGYILGRALIVAVILLIGWLIHGVIS